MTLRVMSSATPEKAVRPLMRNAQQAILTLMIKSFKHKGLRRFYETGSHAGILSNHKKRIRLQLVALDTAMAIEDMDIPGFKLHPLKGERKSIWAISVSGNWRLTFEFRDGNAYLLDYEDYH
jgi:proteic killer suppression protein